MKTRCRYVLELKSTLEVVLKLCKSKMWCYVYLWECLPRATANRSDNYLKG